MIFGIIVWAIIAEWLGFFFIPHPSEVAITLFEYSAQGEILARLLNSLRHMFVGFGLGAVAGVSIGLVMGRSAIVEYALDPWVTALYSTPSVTLIPILIIWFGVGFETRVVLVFLFCVFPVLVNTLTGAKNVERPLIEAGLSFGASKRELWTKIILPAITPYIMAGLRLGMGLAVRGMVVAELFVQATGLGFLLLVASSKIQMDVVFAALVLLMIVGLSLTEILKFIERRLTGWKSL